MTPYRTAADVEAGDYQPPWLVRHLGTVVVIGSIVFLFACVHVSARRDEDTARSVRAAKHGATLAKLRRMTWPEMLTVTP